MKILQRLLKISDKDWKRADKLRKKSEPMATRPDLLLMAIRKGLDQITNEIERKR